MRNNVVLLFLSIFFSVFSNAQTNIYGTWKIDGIIGAGDYKEYSLVVQKKFSLGSNLRLNLDGTFESSYFASCGNDCFTSSSGRFMLIDEVHIRFVLVDIRFSGFCGGNLKSETELNRDLGIFYIYKDSDSVRLIKSNGVLEDDKNKILYNELMDSFDWKSYDFVWNNTKGNDQEDIIKDCIDNRELIDFSNCKVVFLKKEKYGDVILVQENSNFHFVIYDDFKKKVSLAYPRVIE
ncbi:hypothetical protein [Flavobacterium sp.]|uniref:hypothetical protein n=1 Tax=Flavobacterium sp. TaxID=239 RepID=UPI003D10008D